MQFIHKKPWLLVFLFMAVTIAFVCKICPAYDANRQEALLNDRASDIIGATPLYTGFVPAVPGLSGQGQTIGIADSGLDKGSLSDIHPDLQSEKGKRPRVAMLKSYAGREVPDDPIGHGTHMAATIVGSGKASEGKYRGIAPEATLYFQALLDNQGELKVPANINTLFEPAYEAGVRVHVNAWGGRLNTYSSRSSQIDRFVYQHPDFLPIFGAGNDGPGKGSLTAEANSKNVLTVGSSQVPRPAFSPEARDAQMIADSSSRGPAADGRIKPELLAPGSAIISACSSGVKSNLNANPHYTRLGGTSMAAAVTGGAVALVAEYLEKYRGIANPSSDLLKALLVNGARLHPNAPSNIEGFGILDLAGTILALREYLFQFNENPIEIKEGQVHDYEYYLPEGAEGPFKATLAWVDPPARTGTGPALVNNLNLVVRDPNGKEYYGNDFSGRGQVDGINNIEQVYIKDPIPGRYLITVVGQKIIDKQDYSVVYGQKLKQGIITGVGNKEIELADGEKINLEKLRLFSSVDGQPVEIDQIERGSDIYIAVQSAYIAGSTWDSPGIQVIDERDKPLVVEANSSLREGGFHMDPHANIKEDGAVSVNGEYIDSILDIPSGSEVSASINPGLQTIWRLTASYREVSGFIKHIDSENHELELLNNDKTFKIGPSAHISYADTVVDCSPVDAPYSSGEVAFLGKLTPGMRVTLVISPVTDLVQYIKVSRNLVIGKVKESSEEELILESGKTYRLFPGAAVARDNEAEHLQDLQPGDYIVALLNPGTDDIINLSAFREVVYGRVVYFSKKNHSFYLFDNRNNFKMYDVDGELEVYDRGIKVDQSLITSGNWVRLIIDQKTGQIVRVDKARTAEDTVKTFVSFDQAANSLRMSDGSMYPLNNLTRITKGGYQIAPESIRPGDQVLITTLAALHPWPNFLARVEVKVDSSATPPQLTINAYRLNGVLIVKGSSTADRVILYRDNGSHETVLTDQDGTFGRLFPILENEQQLRVIAEDAATGGITGQEVKIQEFPASKADQFSDIDDYWAKEPILNLARQGILTGFADGSFRPREPITRAEFITLLSRTGILPNNGNAVHNYFSDNYEIPWWAMEAVYWAKHQGLLMGYPGGAVLPNHPVTQSEVITIIGRMIRKADQDQKGATPEERTLPPGIPGWAREAYEQAYDYDWLAGLLKDRFNNPAQPVTRGEAAAVLDTVMGSIGSVRG